jgi:hypothetical protein
VDSLNNGLKQLKEECHKMKQLNHLMMKKKDVMLHKQEEDKANLKKIFAVNFIKNMLKKTQ